MTNTTTITDRKGKYQYHYTEALNQLCVNNKTILFIVDAPCLPHTRHLLYERAFAELTGYSTLEVCYLFAHKTKSYKQLYKLKQPVGDECDYHIINAAKRADAVVLNWSDVGYHKDRGMRVLNLLNDMGVTPYARLNTLEAMPELNEGALLNDYITLS